MSPKAATCLLDVNLLIALAWPQHVHHESAHAWFKRRGRQSWATCPLTQLGFVRLSSNSSIVPDAVSPREAMALLREITALPGHRFWPDDAVPTAQSIFDRVALVGHRQVTDAYLLALTLHHRGRLATFDGGIRDLCAADDTAREAIDLISATS